MERGKPRPAAVAKAGPRGATQRVRKTASPMNGTTVEATTVSEAVSKCPLRIASHPSTGASVKGFSGAQRFPFAQVVVMASTHKTTTKMLGISVAARARGCA
ncbi:hypothetical protein GCM10010254_29470 [Streptomyces chromofuscus]|nr:hypothetical protein GCM10010254_29470 [Streptomyces chromofuscus]